MRIIKPIHKAPPFVVILCLSLMIGEPIAAWLFQYRQNYTEYFIGNTIIFEFVLGFIVLVFRLLSHRDNES